MNKKRTKSKPKKNTKRVKNEYKPTKEELDKVREYYGKNKKESEL